MIEKTFRETEQRMTSASQGENSQQARIWIGETTAHSWDTLVMTAINFKELKVGKLFTKLYLSTSYMLFVRQYII